MREVLSSDLVLPCSNQELSPNDQELPSHDQLLPSSGQELPHDDQELPPNDQRVCGDAEKPLASASDSETGRQCDSGHCDEGGSVGESNEEDSETGEFSSKGGWRRD